MTLSTFLKRTMVAAAVAALVAPVAADPLGSGFRFPLHSVRQAPAGESGAVVRGGAPVRVAQSESEAGESGAAVRGGVPVRVAQSESEAGESGAAGSRGVPVRVAQSESEAGESGSAVSHVVGAPFRLAWQEAGADMKRVVPGGSDIGLPGSVGGPEAGAQEREVEPRGRGIVLPWRVAQQTPAAGNATAAPSENGAGETIEVLSSMAVRFGNFKAGQRLTRDLINAIDHMAKAQPDKPDLVQAKLLGQVLEAINMAFGGETSQAIRKIEPLLPALEKLDDLDFPLAGYAVAVYAGRQGRQLQVVDRYLPKLEFYANKVTTSKSYLSRFTVESWKYERELERTGDSSNEEFLKRCDAAFKQLDNYKIEGDTQTEGRLYGSAINFWLGELVVRLSSPQVSASDKDALRARLDKIVAQSQQYAMAAISDSNQMNTNPEFFFVLMEQTLRMVDYQVQSGNYPLAREILLTLEQPVTMLKKLLTETDKVWLANMDSVLAQQAAIKAELAAQGIVYDISGWRFSLVEGDFSKVSANYHRSWERLLRAEAKAGVRLKGDLALHLNSAARYQASLVKGQGYLGLEDVGWDRILDLLERKPKNWVAQVQGELQRQRQMAGQFLFRPASIQALILEGETALALHKKADAQRSFQKAVEEIEVYLNEVGGGSINARIRRDYQRAYDLLTQLQIEQGQAKDAYGTLGRAQQMSSLLTTSVRGEGQVGQLQTLRTQSSALEQELVKRRENREDTKLVEELLAKNKAEFHSTLNLLRQKNPAYESVLAIRPVNFSKQQQFIPDDTAVVQYFPTDSALYIFVATKSDLKIRRVGISQQQLYGQVNEFRRNGIQSYLRQVERGTATGIDWSSDSPLKRSLLTLHKALLEPVEGDIADKQVVAFIPTGQLNYIPMQALAKPHPQKGLEFLVERKQCVVLLKSSDLDQLSRATRPGRGGVFAFGNPDGSLKSAEKEVEVISKTFPGSKTFFGPEATLEKLKLVDDQISYVHLATHGQLDSTDPNATYLVLAGSKENNKLRIPQIYDLKFDKVRLVTLSACDTALGEKEPGSELTSLADAFSVAGSNSVLASLWPVADASTQVLMEQFYSGLQEGKSISAALQAAEVKLLQNPKTAHPFYWAPFTLIGDWR